MIRTPPEVYLQQEENMENNSNRLCPVCGNKVIGRSDKKYCCDECRSYSNNLKYRKQKNRLKKFKTAERIEKDLITLCNGGATRYLKIIAAVTLFCKIMYKFGHQNERI